MLAKLRRMDSHQHGPLYRALEPDDAVIDSGISEAVRVLRENGVETFESCEGGHGHAFTHPTIRFHGTKRCGMLALGVALKHCWQVKSLGRVWSLVEDEPTGPYWELIFHKAPC